TAATSPGVSSASGPTTSTSQPVTSGRATASCGRSRSRPSASYGRAEGPASVDEQAVHRRTRVGRSVVIRLDPRTGLLVHPLDVALELRRLDAPLEPPADLDRGELTGADESVGLRRGDVQHLHHVGEREEP